MAIRNKRDNFTQAIPSLGKYFSGLKQVLFGGWILLLKK